jgi:cytochrome c551/c552
MLGLSIFFVYTGALYGSMILSVYFRGKSKGYNHYSYLTKDYADIATDKKSYGYGLGVVTFMSIIFIYAQLLHKIDIGIVSYLLISFVFYIGGLMTLFNYKSSLHLSSIFGNIKEQILGKVPDTTIDEIDEINENASASKNSAGSWGLILMSFAMWFFIGAVSLSTDKDIWASSDIITVLLSPRTLINFLQFVIASFALASITFVFRKYYWEADINHDNENYRKYALNLNLWIALINLIIIPAFYLIGIFNTPKHSYSPMFFVTTLVGVISVFIAMHQVYGILKTNNTQLIKYAFFLFILAFSLLGIKEKIAFGVANHDHILVLNEEYIKHKAEFLASMGVAEAKPDGAEIYKRCMACHRDEDSPTAPAHKNALAKYFEMADPKAEIMKFVSNPVPKNPKWNPMPNQGLKPLEVEAVVDYMIAKYGGAKTEAAPKDSLSTGVKVDSAAAGGKK